MEVEHQLMIGKFKSKTKLQLESPNMIFQW